MKNGFLLEKVKCSLTLLKVRNWLLSAESSALAQTPPLQMHFYTTAAFLTKIRNSSGHLCGTLEILKKNSARQIRHALVFL